MVQFYLFSRVLQIKEANGDRLFFSRGKLDAGAQHVFCREIWQRTTFLFCSTTKPPACPLLNANSSTHFARTPFVAAPVGLFKQHTPI